MVELSDILNYREKTNLLFELVIYSGGDVMRNFRGEILAITAPLPSVLNEKTKIATFDKSIDIALNVQQLKEKRSKELFKMFAVIILYAEKVFIEMLTWI